MAITGKRRTTIGVGHDGAPHPGAFVPFGHPPHPHAIEASNQAGGMVDHANTHATLGKTPKPKHAFLTAPPIAASMQAKSRRTGEHFHGLSGQDLSRYDANPGDDPIAPGAPRKRLTEPKISPTMRSRTSPGMGDEHFKMLGKLLLASAAAAPDDKQALAHYGIGTLPDAVSED